MHHRRLFLRQMVATLPFLLAGGLSLSACRKKRVKGAGKKVLVIGAGISGLAAAQKLKQQQFEVTVLEARDRIGGRIHTLRDGGINFDAGASWIHGTRRNPLSQLAQDAGAATFATNEDLVKVFDINGALYADGTLIQQESLYQQALQAVVNAGNQQESFAQVFGRLYPNLLNDRLWTYFLSAYLEFDTSADINRLSSKFFDDDSLFGGSEVVFPGGYDQLLQPFTTDLSILLNEVVTKVEMLSNGVQVTTTHAAHTADFVVITLPLGVLRAGHVAFEPALPATMQQAIHRTEMGTVNKFLMVWDQPFWDLSQHYFGFTPHSRGLFNYFLNLKPVNGANALMTFGYGEAARLAEQRSDSQLQAEAMGHLRQMFGSQIPNPHTFKATRWANDPFARGAYSYATVGGSSADFDFMGGIVADRLFFAGEHTSRQYRGTAHGAYLSGVRAAEGIMERL
ncbi:MAG: amine oxidase [Sphingobacteriaceae bacterium]|nr:amine oxidase [Sphingobacteriaceae bacterium]